MAPKPRHTIVKIHFQVGKSFRGCGGGCASVVRRSTSSGLIDSLLFSLSPVTSSCPDAFSNPTSVEESDGSGSSVLGLSIE